MVENWEVSRVKCIVSFGLFVGFVDGKKISYNASLILFLYFTKNTESFIG